MPAPDARAKAEALLALERDASAAVICNFMRACGVRIRPGQVPDAIQQELTRFGYAVLDIGNDYAHDKDTIPHRVPESQPPSGAFDTPTRPPSVPRTPAIEPKRPPKDRSRR